MERSVLPVSKREQYATMQDDDIKVECAAAKHDHQVLMKQLECPSKPPQYERIDFNPEGPPPPPPREVSSYDQTKGSGTLAHLV